MRATALLPDVALLLYTHVRKEAVLSLPRREELGIARELTGRQRDRMYGYAPYLAVLEEGVE